MLIKVFPVDISFDSDWLTYFVKDKQKKYLKIGSLVSIPIKNRISFWVVSSVESQDNYNNIKAIVDLVCSFPILSEYQVKLILRISERYFLPIHKVLNLFLPKYILTRFDNNAFQDVINLEEKKPNLSHKLELIHNITGCNIYDYLISKINLNEKTAIIIWDDVWVDFFIDKLKLANLYNPESLIIFKNSFTYARKYKIFLEIMQAQKNIIIWTRKIIQYNLAHFDNIYYLEDSICKYLYNQNEKYENLTILKFLIELNYFNINIISTVPSINLIQITKKYNFLYNTI